MQEHTQAAVQGSGAYRAGHVQKVGEEGCSVVVIDHGPIHASVESGSHVSQSSIVHHSEVGCLGLYHTRQGHVSFS